MIDCLCIHTITFDAKLNPQFQPSRVFEFVAVVEAYRKTPVKIVETQRVPLRPKLLISTRRPPNSAPGTPKTVRMRLLR